MSADVVTHAEWYAEMGLALTPLRGKAPIRAAWNHDENLITTSKAARAYWSAHSGDNIGACLERSGLVSLDADDPVGAHLVLAAEAIDLNALIAETPTIIGRAPRLEFAAPPGVTLSRKTLVWPPHAKGEKPVTVLELRAGRVQDVLPPSIHPDTRQRYRWITPLLDEFPVLPDTLLRLWLEFEAFRHRARNLCPWADPEPEPVAPPLRPVRQHTGPSVIAEFNACHDAVSVLEAHGFTKVGKRWKSPNGHGVAGVVLLPSGKVYCHHASDDLADGRAHDAFDLFTQFEHGGNVRAAVRAASAMMGFNQRGHIA